MTTATVFDCANGLHAPVCAGCGCECHDTPVTWGIAPGSTFADREEALLDGAEIPYEEAVLAAMYVIRRARTIADAELLHAALGLDEDCEPCVYSTTEHRPVPVSSLRRSA